MMKTIFILIAIIISSSSFAKDTRLPPYFEEQIRKAVYDSKIDIEITVKTKDLSAIEEALIEEGYYYKKIKKTFTTGIFIHVLSNLDIPLIKKYKLQVDRNVLMDSIKRCRLYRENPSVFFTLVKIPDVNVLNNTLEYDLLDAAKNRVTLYCNKRINKLRHFISTIDFLKLVAKDPDYYLY